MAFVPKLVSWAGEKLSRESCHEVRKARVCGRLRVQEGRLDHGWILGTNNFSVAVASSAQCSYGEHRT